MKFCVLTASDRCAAGLAEDRSGPLISELTAPYGETLRYACVPDERETIAKTLVEMCGLGADIVFTTGGTGFAPRDVTPEATLDVIEKQVPGIPEAIRAESLKITHRAMLSRATAGIRGKTLIVNLPGSPKAVRESIAVVLPVLEHAVETMSGQTQSCARD